MKKYILLFLSFSFILSCNVTPEKIKYGQDHCSHCDMTVVDKTHAAQYVTKKGRSYSFDAIECLIWKLQKENNENQMAFILVTDYNRPETLIEAKLAIFLISEKIKSPMSANLSAFKSEEEAQKALNKFGGKLYNWDEIKTQLAR